MFSSHSQLVELTTPRHVNFEQRALVVEQSPGALQDVIALVDAPEATTALRLWSLVILATQIAYRPVVDPVVGVVRAGLTQPQRFERELASTQVYNSRGLESNQWLSDFHSLIEQPLDSPHTITVPRQAPTSTQVAQAQSKLPVVIAQSALPTTAYVGTAKPLNWLEQSIAYAPPSAITTRSPTAMCSGMATGPPNKMSSESHVGPTSVARRV